MIYLFHGSDTDTARKKAFAWVAAARAKEPQLVYARLAASDVSDAALTEAAGAGGLFVKRLLVLIDDPYAKTKAADDVEDTVDDASATGIDAHIDALAASDNAIVILAPGLTIARAKKITAKATKEYKFDRVAAAPARGFNSALVNALASRDAGKLWLEVVRAIRAGDAPEMLHGLLHWKARDIMEKGARAWPSTEARALSLKLIMLLGDARRTGTDLALALERFALSIRGV
ncbi:MAG: hypothetical protein B7X04_02770 [Parcubacteria group bacterium 21-54-25]|nr:MAG: hypothetical protein B7X04_02770 [Parcubacteria group bacterium 21-54-25]HQU07723.1 hypothetical protein [Candidatus Paceibacterota bacterium]